MDLQDIEYDDEISATDFLENNDKANKPIIIEKLVKDLPALVDHKNRLPKNGQTA